jgi:aspartate kinase
MTVCKFGGSSLADASQMKKMSEIVRRSPERSVVVVSAPGKRRSDDEKITDILISCHALAAEGRDISERFALVRERYIEIAQELHLGQDLGDVLDEVERTIGAGASYSEVVSRGEYLGAQLVSRYLGFTFVDAAEIIRFADERPVDDTTTDELVRARLDPGEGYVVPGFYGGYEDGRVQLFSRGGSDISAALLARALDADVYENWTDVSGLLSADPRIVPDPSPITKVSYRELRELAYLGAAVFHEEAVAPVARKNIPINIRNTNEPDHPGTTIAGGAAEGGGVSNRAPTLRTTGVAGRTGFKTVLVERSMLSKDAGYVDSVRAAFAEADVPVRHAVSGSDSLLLVCPAGPLSAAAEGLTRRLRRDFGAEHVDIGEAVAIVGVVYPAKGVHPGVLSRIMAAFEDAGVALRYVSVGESPHTAVFGVEESHYEEAVRAVYRGARGE